LEVSQLLPAVRSPAAAVKNKHRVVSGQILGEMERPAIHGLNLIVGKNITSVELSRHDSSSRSAESLFSYPVSDRPLAIVSYRSAALSINASGWSGLRLFVSVKIMIAVDEKH
jgi:hypothetical protein